VLATIAGVVAGCGRVGYDPAIRSQYETGGGPDGSADREGGRDVDPLRPEPAWDAPLAEAAPDLPPADRAPTVDSTSLPDAMPPDVAPPLDAALPRDSAPDVADTGPPMQVCQSFPANDMIADFEGGTLATNRVGARGGSPFHMVDPTRGTLANVVLPFCGQRAMHLQSSGSPGGSPLVQGHLMPDRANPDEELYDARAYRGIALALRASTPISVRLKLPNGDTTGAGNDHFQVVLNVGTEWSQFSNIWAAFKQVGSATQFPSLDVRTLYAVEISASLPAGASLWVDNIAFVR
jgi:hypothetical protein